MGENNSNAISDKNIYIILFVVAIILIIAIWYWESAELKKLEQGKNVEEVPPEQKEEQYQKYGCYSWTTEVVWRRVVLGTLIASVIIYFFLRNKIKTKVTTILVVSFIILATFMVLEMFRSYHVSRTICYKVNPNGVWFSEIDGTR